MKNLWILVPTYNEKDNITNIITEILRSSTNWKDTTTHILVLDDNSPDGTGRLVEELSQKYKTTFDIKLLSGKSKQGLGKAYISGFKWVIHHTNFDYVLQMDADFSHNPQYISDMLMEIEKFDYVIGSRYVKGGGVRNWTWDRKLLSRIGNLGAFLVLWVRILDYTGGFNMYRKEVIKSLDLDRFFIDGYGFLIELKYRARKAGFHYKEVPIIFPDRIMGQSKMSGAIMLEIFLKIIKLRMELH